MKKPTMPAATVIAASQAPISRMRRTSISASKGVPGADGPGAFAGEWEEWSVMAEGFLEIRVADGEERPLGELAREEEDPDPAQRHRSHDREPVDAERLGVPGRARQPDQVDEAHEEHEGGDLRQ